MPNCIFKAIYLAGLVAGSAIRAVYRWRSRGRAAATTHAGPLDAALLAVASLGFVLPLVYVLTARLDFADYPLPAAIRLVGAAVFAGALWLLWRSHADLGPNWSAVLRIHAGHTLVTEGVYRRVRHPMYAAHWLWGAAQALLLANWAAGPAMLVSFLPLYLLRVPREERMMLEHFGDAYRAYIRRTGRILPRLSP